MENALYACNAQCSHSAKYYAKNKNLTLGNEESLYKEIKFKRGTEGLVGIISSDGQGRERKCAPGIQYCHDTMCILASLRVFRW